MDKQYTCIFDERTMNLLASLIPGIKFVRCVGIEAKECEYKLLGVIEEGDNVGEVQDGKADPEG